MHWQNTNHHTNNTRSDHVPFVENSATSIVLGTAASSNTTTTTPATAAVAAAAAMLSLPRYAIMGNCEVCSVQRRGARECARGRDCSVFGEWDRMRGS